jgi:hypothetical protein
MLAVSVPFRQSLTISVFNVMSACGTSVISTLTFALRRGKRLGAHWAQVTQTSQTRIVVSHPRRPNYITGIP